MDTQNAITEQEQWLQIYADAKKHLPPPETIWFDFEPPAPAARNFIEHSQPRESPERKPQERHELSPAQLAQRQRWAGVLLEGATDRTSYRIAERLIKDWFGEKYDRHLMEVQERLE